MAHGWYQLRECHHAAGNERAQNITTCGAAVRVLRMFSSRKNTFYFSWKWDENIQVGLFHENVCLAEICFRPTLVGSLISSCFYGPNTHLIVS